MSTIVCPSFGLTDVEQSSFSLGHLQNFSTHGVEYVSTLLQTDQGLQRGKFDSEKICLKKKEKRMNKKTG